MKPPMLLALLLGMALEAFGLLFLLQGAGVVRWPASSFMIDQKIWIVLGALISLSGTFTMMWAIRKSR
jgi:hypothetical protein